jgi:pyruvate,water dikinase
MTWAIVKRFMSGQGGYGLMYRDLGFDPDPALDADGVFDLVCGRPYCNLSLEPRMQYRTLPFEHPFEVLKKNPNKALYPQAVFNPAKAGWKFWLFLPFAFLKLIRSGARLTAARRAFDANFENRIVPPFLQQVEAAAREDWSGKTDQELLALLEHWRRVTLIDFARHSLQPTVFAALAMGNLERVLTRRLNPSGVTTPTEDGQLPGMKKAQEALRKLVMGIHAPEETDLGGSIRALREGRLSLEEFLRRFGHRGNQEMELALPRWSEDHGDLERMAGSGAAARAANPQAGQAAADVWEQVAAEAKLAAHERKAVEA